VYSWGNNLHGQLARNTVQCPADQPCVADFPEGILSIEAGFSYHALAVTTSGKVLSWGQNFYGELGSGKFCNTECKRQTPDYVTGGETGTAQLEHVTAIAAGQSHSYALLATGEVLAWGNNSSGQLGNGTFDNSAQPVFVRKSNGEILNNIRMISAGANHGYALDNKGQVYAWGSNSSNQLGVGISSNRPYPTLIVDNTNQPITNVQKIDGGALFGLLLKTNGTVWGVGAFKGSEINENGIPTYKTQPYAMQVEGGQTPNQTLSNVIDISAGTSHSLAITVENQTKFVVAWGDNRFPDLSGTAGGQIGNGNTSIKQYFSPQYVRSNDHKLHDAVAIYAGSGISYILTQSVQRRASMFYVSGSATAGALGTENNKDEYQAVQLDRELCQPYCEILSLGNSRTYCTPFNEELIANLSTDDYRFIWHKDNVLQSEQSNTITLTSGGVYTAEALNIHGNCPSYKDSVEIHEKQATFTAINSSFCGKTLHYKVVGEGNFTWQTTYNGEKIGQGQTLSIPPSKAEELVAGKQYRVWVEHIGECQVMPVELIENCNCNTPPPMGNDTASCYNRPYFVHAQGDSVLWYSDYTLQKPVHFGNTYKPKYLPGIGTYSLYATQIKNACESEAHTTYLQLNYCEPWFTVEGQVFANNAQVAHTTVYLYDVQTQQPIDSCTTNDDGRFTLYSQGNKATLYALSPFSTFYNTWAGNTKEQSKAHIFYVDATIKGVEIALIPTTTHIELLCNADFWNADYIRIYTVNGASIGTVQPSLDSIKQLCTTSNIYILQAVKNNVVIALRKIRF
jgi:alpha-tubulin suppressor-like RCC1 family protein